MACSLTGVVLNYNTKTQAVKRVGEQFRPTKVILALQLADMRRNAF
jgi:hypothetical protein